MLTLLSLRRLATDRRGVTMLEYGLLAALIAGACVAAVTTLGGNINSTFTNIAGSMLTGATTPATYGGITAAIPRITKVKNYILAHSGVFGRRFLRDTRGVTMLEYGLIAALIAATCVAAVGTVGTGIRSTFSNIAEAI